MLRPGSLALTTLLAMLTGLGPLSMDMYLPSLPDIARVLQAPTARVQLTISSYLIGFAVGQVIYGPLSDRYGRRPVLLGALILYATATLVCAATQSIDTLIAARFVQAIGGSGSIVLARAMVRDLYSGVRAGRELSLMGSIMGFAPIMAPMIGGILQTAFGWRASFILLGGIAVIAIAVVGRLLPETLHRRASEPISLSSLSRNYGAVLRHRGFLAYLGIITVTYAGLFAWVAGGSVVLQGVYGLSAFAFGFTFAIGAAGYVVGTMIAARRVLRLGLDRTIGLGVVLVAGGGLAVAAVVAAGIPNAVWLVAAMALYLAGLGLSMPQAMAGALTPFPDRAGTASSLMGFVQQTVAAIVAAAVGAYLGRSAWPVAGVVAVMGCLAFLLWAFTRRLRAHER
ncbi:MAG: multidrug effflux MFS transporter [Xanthobacteraceae bacterium]|jgi:DHA1 family bicyclomycin/chloramphenicol resistance-like MFS transporter